MRTWGLTGGIGAGKSEAARVLRSLGVPVLDADRIARFQMQPGLPVFDAVVAAFGAGILAVDGHVDRAVLSAVVFADPARRAHLDMLTHGPVMDEVRRRLVLLAGAGHPLAFVEAALLFETGLEQTLDGTVAIMAPADVRTSRVCARDGVDESAVRARIAAQTSDATRRACATHVIENTSDLAGLRDAISCMLVRILTVA